MVSGLLKSGRLAKVKIKCTKSTRTHYNQRIRSIAKCAVTKKPLRGIPRMTNKRFGKLNKSKKTVARPFGGYMSHNALKEKILSEMVFEE